MCQGDSGERPGGSDATGRRLAKENVVSQKNPYATVNTFIIIVAIIAIALILVLAA